MPESHEIQERDPVTGELVSHVLHGPPSTPGSAIPASVQAAIDAATATVLQDAYHKRRYMAVAQTITNPTDVLIAGIDYESDAAAALTDYPQGVVTLSVDEGAATVVGDVAYWVSGWAGWALEDGGSVISNQTSDYLPYILRYDLANDAWLPSVKIPAPAGALPAAPTPYVLDTSTRETTWRSSNDDAFTPGERAIARIGVVTYTGAPIYLQMPFTLPQDMSFAIVDLDVSSGYQWEGGSLDTEFTPPLRTSNRIAGGVLGIHPNGDPGHRLLILVTSTNTDLVGSPVPTGWSMGTLQGAAELGWGFEAGYYGAIGTKLYFGGGDSNLHDIPVDLPMAPWNGQAGWQPGADAGTWVRVLGTIDSVSLATVRDFHLEIPAGEQLPADVGGVLAVPRWWSSDDPFANSPAYCTTGIFGPPVGDGEWTAATVAGGLGLDLNAGAAGSMTIGLAWFGATKPDDDVLADVVVTMARKDPLWSSGSGRQLMSYDTVAGTFATHAPRPVGLDYGGFAVADGKLYTLDGDGPNLGIYDPSSDAWVSHDVSVVPTVWDNWIWDWCQGVQVGRWLYWPDSGIKLNLDADPTTAEAWIALPAKPLTGVGSQPGWDADAAVALGHDGKIHVFANSFTGYDISHAVLDPMNDTWSVVTDRGEPYRSYFSAAQNPQGEWRFIGGGSTVICGLMTEDPVLTETQRPSVIAQALSAATAAASALPARSTYRRWLATPAQPVTIQIDADLVAQNCKIVRATIVGGGGGGAGGRRGAPGTIRTGGGGGAGAGVTVVEIPVAQLNAGQVLSPQVGPGGAGGTGAISDNTNGNDGRAGGWSYLSLPLNSDDQLGMGNILPVGYGAEGGAGGKLGAAAAGGPAVTSLGGMETSPGGSGGSSSAAGGAGGDGQSPTIGPGAGGGGAGGGLNAANGTSDGGDLGGGGHFGAQPFSKGTVDFPDAPVQAPYPIIPQTGTGGNGGGGGASSFVSRGGDGGPAYFGGGGGGGGASSNGNRSGNGGHGGDGYVLIEAW